MARSAPLCLLGWWAGFGKPLSPPLSRLFAARGGAKHAGSGCKPLNSAADDAASGDPHVKIKRRHDVI